MEGVRRFYMEAGVWHSRGGVPDEPAMQRVPFFRLRFPVLATHAEVRERLHFAAWCNDNSRDFITWFEQLKLFQNDFNAFRDTFMRNVGVIRESPARGDVIRGFAFVTDAFRATRTSLYEFNVAKLLPARSAMLPDIEARFHREAASLEAGNFMEAWEDAYNTSIPKIKSVEKSRRIDTHVPCCGMGGVLQATLPEFLHRICNCELRTAVAAHTSMFERVALVQNRKIRDTEVGLSAVNLQLNSLVENLDTLWRECAEAARVAEVARAAEVAHAAEIGRSVEYKQTMDAIASRKRGTFANVFEESAAGGGGQPNSKHARMAAAAEGSAGGGGGVYDVVQVADDYVMDLSDDEVIASYSAALDKEEAAREHHAKAEVAAKRAAVIKQVRT